MGHGVKDLFESKNLGPCLQIVHINMQISVIERYIRRQIVFFFNGNAKENVQDTVIMLTSMKIMRMKAEYKAQFPDTHALTRKYIVSINFSTCSLGEEDKHFSKASTTDAVQYNMVHL